MVVMAVTPGGPQNASLTSVCNVHKKYNIPPKETLSDICACLTGLASHM